MVYIMVDIMVYITVYIMVYIMVCFTLWYTHLHYGTIRYDYAAAAEKLDSVARTNMPKPPQGQ